MENALCGSEPGLKLIETLSWDGVALARLPRHMARLARSAARLGWACEPGVAARALHDACPDGPARMRLTLDAQGRIEVTAAPLPPLRGEWRVALAAPRLDARDPWLGIKSTHRALHDRARAGMATDLDELLFLNQHDELCEGTISNLFFDLGEGLCTPPASVGLLPGILREEMIETGICRERSLHRSELPRARLWLGNALRGLIPARLHAQGLA